MLRKERKSGLDATAIKLIALVIMTIDHLAAYGMGIPFARDNYLLMRQIGRAAAPLFLFAFTDSMRHTRNRKAFLLRLYTASVLVGVGNAVLGELLKCSFGNILQTFAWTAALVFSIDAFLERKSLKAFGLFSAALLLSAFTDALILRVAPTHFWIDAVRAFICPPVQAEYSVGMIALGVLWYYIGDKNYCAVLLLILCVPAFFGFYQTPELIMFSGIQQYMVLAVPFMLFYNGEKGRGMKNFFYIYYPLHVWLIAAVNKLI